MTGMVRTAKSPPPDILRGALAGTVAGVVASFVVDLAMALGPPDRSDDRESPSAKMADVVEGAVKGAPVPKAEEPLAGQLVHYLFGAGLGLVYGVAAEFRPKVTVGRGAVAGLAVAMTAADGAVPALGLSPPPWKMPATMRLLSTVGHIVFGMVGEFTRSHVRSTLLPKQRA